MRNRQQLFTFYTVQQMHTQSFTIPQLVKYRGHLTTNFFFSNQMAFFVKQKIILREDTPLSKLGKITMQQQEFTVKLVS